MIELDTRYGQHDFQVLTERHRRFLSEPRIAENRDVAGFETVDVESIRVEDGVPVLKLQDVFRYTFGRNRKSVFDYSAERLPVYRELLRTELLSSRDMYLFDQKDGIVVVRFGSVKERA